MFVKGNITLGQDRLSHVVCMGHSEYETANQRKYDTANQREARTPWPLPIHRHIATFQHNSSLYCASTGIAEIFEFIVARLTARRKHLYGNLKWVYDNSKLRNLEDNPVAWVNRVPP